MDYEPLWSPRVLSLLCYPPHKCPLGVASSRAARLESLGVAGLCDIGSTEIYVGGGTARVIGKGHSSVVLAVAARWSPQPLALKVRRYDSKRPSLRDEGRALQRASRAGAAPQAYYYDDDLILMDYLGPVTLEAVLSAGMADAAADALQEALKASRALDCAHVVHQELHRPYRNFVYPYWPLRATALVVDLESASEGCGNVNKLVGFIYSNVLGAELPRELQELLRAYKRLGCPRDLYDAIESEVVSRLETLRSSGPGAVNRAASRRSPGPGRRLWSGALPRPQWQAS